MENTIPQTPNLISKPEPQNNQPAFAQAKPQNGEETVFFNVMPKVDSKGAFVEPKINVVVTDSSPKKNNFIELVKKYKLFIIIGLGVLVVGAGIYFIAGKIGSGGYETEDLLIKQPAGQNGMPKTGTQSGFSTSQAWRDKYFPSCIEAKTCGDSADPDHDGLTNAQEYKLGTDPNNPDSDQDGLADGDEVNVFGTDPLNSHTGKDPKYSDSDFMKGGFNILTEKKMSASEISALTDKMKQIGLHEPTVTTLSGVLNTLYNFSAQSPATVATSTLSSAASSTGQSALDESVEAKQGRDAQRSVTIKNLEIALVKYQADNKGYPLTDDFNVMYSAVKLYLKVATNPIDPINKAPYVYAYSSNQDGSDFSLSFYSEVAGQAITKNAAAAIKDAAKEEASIYDNQRQTDLESIRTALLLYSQNNVAGSQDYVFPTKAKYKTSIVPQYISQIPVDPKTKADYAYEVSPTFDTFTLKAVLDNPPTGTTGYMCNQDECQNY